MPEHKPVRVEKPWGYELIWAHTGRYVGKILHVRACKHCAHPTALDGRDAVVTVRPAPKLSSPLRAGFRVD